MLRFRSHSLVLGLVALATALLAVLGAPAHAQSTVEAEKLFRDGKSLMKKGKLAEACDAFEASQRIESNLATLMSLADCREKNGQFASAWGFFLKAESLTRNDISKGQANVTARKRAALLEPRLSYLTVNVPDESRVDGLAVSRNGIVIDPGTWNRAVPIDGGEYTIEGKAPGHEGWSTQVTVKTEGDKQSVEVPKFKELPKLIEPDPKTEPQPYVPMEEPSPWTTKRKVAVGVAGGSVVSFGAALGFGLVAKSLRDKADKGCLVNCTPADARRSNDRIKRSNRWGMASNVALGVGLAAAGTAVYLWFTGAPTGAFAEEETEEAPEAGEISLRPAVGEFTGFTLDVGF
jgi:hypothetical protein